MGNIFCRGDRKRAEVAEQTTTHQCDRVSHQTRINDYDRSMLQLKIQRDKLSAASRMYEERAEMERNAAKTLLAEGKRDKALYCLKRRKAQEVHLSRVQQYLDNIMTMIQSVEDRQLSNEVAIALKQGADELKALNEHLSLSDIEEIMTNASEQIQITSEASALLSQNLVSLDADDDELLAELEAISTTGGAAKVSSLPTSSSRPKVKADTAAPVVGEATNTSTNTKRDEDLEGLVVPTTALEREKRVVAENEHEADETHGLLGA